MKKLIALSTFLIVFVSAWAGNNPASKWQDAANAYIRKDYSTAAAIYEAMLRENPMQGAVCFNLGNTYYRMNRLPEAVLQYQRAAFLQVEAKSANENTQIAQQRIPNSIRKVPDIFFVRWWYAASSGSTANIWAAACMLIFLGVLTLLWLSKSRPGSVPMQFIAMAAFVWVCCLVPAYYSAENARISSLAVVLNSGAVISPSLSTAKGSFPVPEATVVETGARKGIFITVTLPDNRMGWMRVDELGFVQPKK